MAVPVNSLDMPSWCDYTSFMIRTQIQLTPEQARRLRARARREGVSLAEMVRRCVDVVLAQDQASRSSHYERAVGIVGAFRDPAAAGDAAREHDRFLDEAFR
jgi:hypothetical protein